MSTWPVDLVTLFQVVGRHSMAWQFLFSLANLAAPTADLDLVAVRGTLAASLSDKDPLRLPVEEPPAPPTSVDVAALQGTEAAGQVDIDALVSAIRKEAAEARPAQRDMVAKLREWIDAGRPALVEAPTGTGKSLAAWAVALEWLNADPANRVVMSTYTKQLQAQLADDLWKLEQTGIIPGIIGLASLVKGASNRLSVQGLVRVLADLARADSGSRRVSRGEFLGDSRFAELVLYLCSRLIAEANPVEEWEGHSVDTVDVEPFFGDYLYRRPSGQPGLRLDTYLKFLSQAQGGDYEPTDAAPAEHTSSVAEALSQHRIVIANHALLLHHLDDFPDPAHTLLIVDEAHSLEAAATASLSAHFDYPLMEEAVRELRDWIRPADPADAAAVKAHEMLSNSLGALEEWLRHERLPSSALRAFETVGRDPLHPDALRTVGVASPLDGPGGERKRTFMDAISQTARLVGGAHHALRAQPPRADRIEEDRRWALLRSFNDLDDALKGIREHLEAIRDAGPLDTPGNRIVWADEQVGPTRERRRYRFGITSSPIELGREPDYRRFLSAFGQLFFISATLRVAGTWEYILERLGLDPSQVDSHDLPSPFKVGQQAKLICFTDFPSWAEQESVALQSVAQQVHGFLAEMASGNQNGVMVLTTSRAAAAGVGDRLLRLRGQLDDPYRIADARISGNARAVKEFQRSGGALVGTKGLWAGVDVADPERMRMVWINKLPFAPFGDPVMSARRELVRRRAEDGNDPDPDGTAMVRYYLPMAAMELRQGVGRLIRSQSHRGVI
ncbi:MAG: ATP-dependent DNA helicase, partial [Candidatus Limnocylindria bacterium]